MTTNFHWLLRCKMAHPNPTWTRCVHPSHLCKSNFKKNEKQSHWFAWSPSMRLGFCSLWKTSPIEKAFLVRKYSTTLVAHVKASFLILGFVSGRELSLYHRFQNQVSHFQQAQFCNTKLRLGKVTRQITSKFINCNKYRCLSVIKIADCTLIMINGAAKKNAQPTTFQ